MPDNIRDKVELPAHISPFTGESFSLKISPDYFDFRDYLLKG
jgi:hypothetical protein